MRDACGVEIWLLRALGSCVRLDPACAMISIELQDALETGPIILHLPFSACLLLYIQNPSE